jgi:hypothetical protein|nr:MAC/perforin domain-containing protein [Bacteroides intestinalis]
MKKLFYFAISICMLYACSSDSDFSPEDETTSDVYEFKTIPDKEVVFKTYPTNMKQILGAGYDVTADNLSPEAIKAPIIDLDKLANSDIYDFTRMKATSTESKDYAGENATAFLTNISNSLILEDVNSKNVLSIGTILKHKEFQSDYNHSSQYSFASCEQLFTAERWYFSPFYISEKYKYRYLTQEFENDVTSLTAESIINKYGTHFLIDVCIGARFRGLYRTTVPTATSATDIVKITLVSALTKMAQQGFSTGSSVGGWEEEVAQSIGGQLIFEFYGGNTTLLPSLPTTADLNTWLKSFNEENYTLTKITQNKVLPIYDMIKDATKRKQVKDAIEKYISNQKLSSVSTTPLLQAWNGKNHTYDTSYLDIATHSNKKYEGAVCSIYKQQRTHTVPLYLYSNGQKQRLSVESLQSDAGWQLEKELGYVYTSPVDGAIPLYEAANENDYCYTIENKQEYGIEGSWKKTGIVCYTMPL